MSFFLSFAKQFNPSEEKLNNIANTSFCGRFYNAITRLISFIKIRLNLNSFILDNLDDFYFFSLAVLIFSIPFAETSMLGILASVLIILTVIKSLFTHKKFTFSVLHVPVFVYLLIIFLSVGFSTLFMPSLKGFAKMLVYIGAFFSFFEFLKKNPARIIPTVVMIAVASCIELLFSLKQMIIGVEELAGWQDKTFLNPEESMSRVFGTLKPFNPNLFAAYLLATTPFIFVSAAYAYITQKTKLSLAFLLFGLLALLTIVKTGCRGAYIGLFFGAAFFIGIILYRFKKFIFKYKNAKNILILSLAAVIIISVVAALLSPAIMHRLTSIFTFRGDSSNSYRMNVYISSLKMFLDNFWIGIGPGNTTYRLIYGLYMVTGFDALGAYNIYLEMAVESGIFLPLTFLWMMLLTFVKSIKRLWRVPFRLKLVIIACLSSIVGMLTHGMFDTVWYRPQLQLIFWLYMAILAVITMKGFVIWKKNR